MFETGATVAGWKVEALLDDGPTTLTYKVLCVGDRDVPPGVLRLLKIKDPSFGERLRRNAAALSDHHEHLVDIIEVVEHEGFTGVISEYIDGPDLATWGATRPPLSAVLALFGDIIAGLVEAHQAGLVHRNLKPGKVRVTADHRGLLEDFLLSRVMVSNDQVTALGITFGTPQYMCPEQFHGAADVTARGDLFSAGCVLYELVTGKRAFEGDSIKDVYMAIIDAKYVDPRTLVEGLPEPVALLIDDLLQAATEDRPESAAAVLTRLQSSPLIDLTERMYEPTGLPAARRSNSLPPISQMTTILNETESPADHPTLLDPEELEEPPRQNTGWIWAAAALGLVLGFAGFMTIAVLAGGFLAGR